MEKICLDDLVYEMSSIVAKGLNLLERIGFEDCPEVYGLVEADMDDPNTEYRIKALDKIANDICTAAAIFDFLKRREHKPIRALMRLSGGRYGYIDERGVSFEFHCGHCFEALLTDDEGRQHWTPTSIEYDQDKYYLVHHSDVLLDGLVIRDGR